ncbi:MAG: hypothetical protein QM487_15210 [Candidatus Marithrix sp.]
MKEKWLEPDIQSNNIPYFQTATTVGWIPIFTRPDQWLRENKQFKLYEYVILENHLHFVSSSTEHSNSNI